MIENSPSPFDHDAPAITRELDRILGSQTFARSARSRDLLRYLIQTTRRDGAPRIKETTLALEVFGRSPSEYDSATDGIVRVSMNRLRELLDRYYDAEGHAATLRIDIPRGTYSPVVRKQPLDTLPASPRLAVLPLSNFTGDATRNALCDGLAEDLIDALTRVPGLRVIARTSSFRYRDAARDIRAIARELGADLVLEGSVQAAGELLRVTAQLILARDGTHLWSHAFIIAEDERTSLQQALIELMSRAVNTTAPLPDAPSAAMISPRIQSLVDQARGLNVTQVPDNLAFAETLAQRACSLAPDFADAWFVLAMVRYSRHANPSGAMSTSPGGLRPCQEALERALAIRPDSPQALSLSAYLLITAERRWADALERAKRAVALAPNHGGVNGRLAFIQLALGSADEAVRIYQHVCALDPLAPPARYHHALAMAAAGDIDEALATVATAREELGDSIFARDTECAIHEFNSDYARALAVAISALQRFPGATHLLLHRAHCTAALGDINGARALMAPFPDSKAYPAGGYLRAFVEAGGPQLDLAFKCAESVVACQEPSLMLLPFHPAFERLRADTHWPEFARQVLHYPLP